MTDLEPGVLLSFSSKPLSAVAIIAILIYQCLPSLASGAGTSPAVKGAIPIEPILSAGRAQKGAADDRTLIADACDSCGVELGVAVASADIIEDARRKKSLLTDSLWGNLILELAYDRDPMLGKLARRVRLMNFGTRAAVFGIAGGTLAQGISALYVLNPPDGKPDSYAPLNIGVALSGATMALMAARVLFGHRLAKRIKNRQLSIRDRVERVLAHLESSHGRCSKARSQLEEIIGKRACNEWLQLWRSSHRLADVEDRHISHAHRSTKKVAVTP